MPPSLTVSETFNIKCNNMVDYDLETKTTSKQTKCKKTYQFTTPCKSDEITHPKQQKSFFSGIM